MKRELDLSFSGKWEGRRSPRPPSPQPPLFPPAVSACCVAARRGGDENVYLPSSSPPPPPTPLFPTLRLPNELVVVVLPRGNCVQCKLGREEKSLPTLSVSSSPFQIPHSPSLPTRKNKLAGGIFVKGGVCVTFLFFFTAAPLRPFHYVLSRSFHYATPLYSEVLVQYQ